MKKVVLNPQEAWPFPTGTAPHVAKAIAIANGTAPPSKERKMAKTGFKEANINIRKVRYGFVVRIDHNQDDVYEGDDNYQEPDEFVLSGEELDAEELGKQIVASIVGNRVAPEKPKRR